MRGAAGAILAAIITVGCGSANGGPPISTSITVFAAASLTDAFKALGAAYKTARTSGGQGFTDPDGLLVESEVLGRGSSLESDFLAMLVRPREARRRHQGRLNVAFCDGHVEAETIARLFFVKSTDRIRRWNADNEPHPERWSFGP